MGLEVSIMIAGKTTPAGWFPAFPSNLIGHALSQAFLKWSSILSNVLLSPWVFTYTAHSRWTPWHVGVLYPFSHMQIVCLWTKTLWCFLSQSLRTPYSLSYRDSSLKHGALSPATPCLNQRCFPFSFLSWGRGHMKFHPNRSVLWRTETPVPTPRLKMPRTSKDKTDLWRWTWKMSCRTHVTSSPSYTYYRYYLCT